MRQRSIALANSPRDSKRRARAQRPRQVGVGQRRVVADGSGVQRLRRDELAGAQVQARGEHGGPAFELAAQLQRVEQHEGVRVLALGVVALGQRELGVHVLGRRGEHLAVLHFGLGVAAHGREQARQGAAQDAVGGALLQRRAQFQDGLFGMHVDLLGQRSGVRRLVDKRALALRTMKNSAFRMGSGRAPRLASPPLASRMDFDHPGRPPWKPT